jgi:cytochrome oxidase assembly protein ShyY1
LVLHVLLVVAVIVMINLGFWQLRRLDEKQTRNDEIVDRSRYTVTAIQDLVGPDDAVAVGGDLQFRTAEATGTYSVDDQFLLRGRDLDGRPGLWVYTPLDLGDGTMVAVNRGWIPAGRETDASDVEFATPGGTVTVRGIVEQSFPDPRPAGDRQTTVAHADLEWFDDQVEADAYPVAIRLQQQQPPQDGDLPVVLDPPELDEGPHFSYAVQWFLFTAVALVGYPLLLRRVVQQHDDQRPRDPPVQPDPVGERAGVAP